MSEQPSYRRIADLLRRRVESEEWAPGERLPSRAQFAREYEVADYIVRRAQELLISQGVLRGLVGSGTYVSERLERVQLVHSRHQGEAGGSPFRVDAVGSGKRATVDSGSEVKIPAPDGIASRLAVSVGDPCVRTSYEYLADGKPVQLCTSWEPYDLTRGTIVVLPEDGPLSGRGVVERLAEIGVSVTRLVERQEPGNANAEEALLLGIQRGALVTRFQRTYYSDGGRPVETADIVIPAALCEIVYEVPISR
ncbi:GntR family transcriptional regulator [Streptomyces microflavus]|uniref:GntR family transcriptional regulator n=1 Tax=Streptomyces microflavus TaxID=1919 RepID=UPI00364A6B5A